MPGRIIWTCFSAPPLQVDNQEFRKLKDEQGKKVYEDTILMNGEADAVGFISEVTLRVEDMRKKYTSKVFADPILGIYMPSCKADKILNISYDPTRELYQELTNLL
jgi:hypothetical protein